jgi:hypothetical protein
MADPVDLLPISVTAFERAMSAAIDPRAALLDRYNSIPVAWRNTPPALLPFVVWQLGLGELSPYLPNLYDLIDDGVRWQRLRGTPASIAKALGWLGYAAALEEAPARRVRWNRIQIGLDRVRDVDAPDLGRIEGVVGLSLPARSDLARGFKGFDVRAAETGYNRTSDSIAGEDSGARLTADGAQWSFGRDYAVKRAIDSIELRRIRAWSDVPDTPQGWFGVSTLWATVDVAWFRATAQQRRNGIIDAIVAARPLIAFRDAAGVAIGYSRTWVRGVASNSAGVYAIDGERWSPSAAASHALVACRTPFGAGAGKVAASAAIAVDPVLAAGAAKGQLWYAPSEIVSAIEIATSPVSIAFGLTVREHVRFVLALEGPYAGADIRIDLDGADAIAASGDGSLLLNG